MTQTLLYRWWRETLPLELEVPPEALVIMTTCVGLRMSKGDLYSKIVIKSSMDLHSSHLSFLREPKEAVLCLHLLLGNREAL